MRNHPRIKLRRKTCLKCHEGGSVLVCKNGNCPIIVHESCISCGARFDDNGIFCCPYCLYKQSLFECRQAKEKALLAKEALSRLLDMSMPKNDRNLQHSRSLKRKEPDLPINMQNRIDATGGEVETDEEGHQPTQREGCQQDDCLDLEIPAGNQQKAGLPMTSYCWKNGTATKEYENLTKKPQEIVKTMRKYQNGSVGKEQTQADLQEISVSLTKKDNRTGVSEGSVKRSDSTFQDDHFVRSQMAIMSKNAKPPAEMGVYCHRTEEWHIPEKSSENATHPMKDSAFVTYKELRILNREHQETENHLEGYNSGIVEKNHDQAWHRGPFVCLTRKEDTIEIPEVSSKAKDSTYQDDYFVRSLMAVNSENHDPPAEIGEDHCGREDEGATSVKLLKNSVRSVRMDIVSETQQELGNLTKKNKIISKTVKEYGGVEQKLTQVELQDPSLCLSRKDNVTGIHDKFDKKSGSTFHDDSFQKSQIAVNSENTDQPSKIGDHPGRTGEEKTLTKASEDVPNPVGKDKVTVPHENSEVPIEKDQATAKKMEGYYDGGLEKQQREAGPQETSVCLTRKVDAEKIPEEYYQGNDFVVQDDYFITKKIIVNSENANKSAEIRPHDCEGPADMQTQAKVPENDVHPIMDRGSVLHEELEAVDSVSSEDSYNPGPGICSKWKSKIAEASKNANLPGRSSEFFEIEFSELEEDEEVTHGISRQRVEPTKRSQRPALPNARRRKLLWTVEEVEMLKEGVQKFWLKGEANKKLPWIKILEYGRHVFDGTRTPVDLKDKWRNLLGKSAKGHSLSLSYFT